MGASNMTAPPIGSLEADIVIEAESSGMDGSLSIMRCVCGGKGCHVCCAATTYCMSRGLMALPPRGINEGVDPLDMQKLHCAEIEFCVWPTSTRFRSCGP